MVNLLRRQNVELAPTAADDLLASPDRVAALRSKDFKGKLTAFDHILRLASAGKLRDGSPSAVMASDLFALAGTSRSPTVGRCYARTGLALFSMHHTGEFARLLTDLAIRGEVKLADKSVLQWDPARTPVANNQYVDTLWAGIAHTARLRVLPPQGNVDVPAQVAARGEMANLTTRLTGQPHVNVAGQEAFPHLEGILARHGPMLAEFGNHAGSVAQIEGGRIWSQEAGPPAPTLGGTLGYVVVPLKEARARKLTVLQYPGDESGYVDASLPRGRELMKLSASTPLQFWSKGSGPYFRIDSAAEFVAHIPSLPDHLLQEAIRGGVISKWVERGLGRPQLAKRMRDIESLTRLKSIPWPQVRREMAKAVRDSY
jgi:hypothetical protein